MTPELSSAAWRKSSMSQDNGGCVEIADLTQYVAVRDAKDPHGPALVFSREQWTAFLAAAAAGEFSRD